MTGMSETNTPLRFVPTIGCVAVHYEIHEKRVGKGVVHVLDLPVTPLLLLYQTALCLLYVLLRPFQNHLYRSLPPLILTIVNLQEHAISELLQPLVLLDLQHGHHHDVRRAALNRRVNRRSAHVPLLPLVPTVDVRQRPWR